MENEVNVKGVSLKELLASFFEKSDSNKKTSQQFSETDKEWDKVLKYIDKKEEAVRKGEEKLTSRKNTGRADSLKGMKVEGKTTRKEEPSISVNQENYDKEK